MFAFWRVLPILITFTCVHFNSVEGKIVWDFESVQGKLITPWQQDGGDQRNSATLLGDTEIVWNEQIESNVVHFRQKSNGLRINGYQGSCLLRAASGAGGAGCPFGFSVSFWVQWRNSSWIKSEDWKLLSFISSSFFNVYYFTERAFPIEIWDGVRNWKTIFIRNSIDENWTFYVMTWHQGVLSIFENGKKVVDHDPVYPSNERTSFAMDDGHIMIGSKAKEEADGVEMLLDDFAIHDKKLIQKEIDKLYFDKNLQALPSEMNRISFHTPSKDKDHVLLNHVMRKKQVHNATECYKTCLKFGRRCQSYNVGYYTMPSYEVVAGEARRGDIQCELNSLTKNDVSAEFFLPKENFTYHEMMG